MTKFLITRKWIVEAQNLEKALEQASHGSHSYSAIQQIRTPIEKVVPEKATKSKSKLE